MEKTVRIFFRWVYGEPKAYPNNDQAKKLATMLKAKTFTKLQLSQIECLGFFVVVDQDPAAVLS